MIRDQNKTFLKVGLGFMSAASVVVVAMILTVVDGLFFDYSMARPIMVVLLAFTALPSFLFLVILGMMPWLFRWQNRYLLTEKEKDMFSPMDFFMIED